MLYQITAPPTAALDKQADELGRLLKHGKTITLQFVTVAGSYKPARARLTLLATPDRVAEVAARAMTVLCGCDDAVKPSAAVRQRPEWKNVALLVPTDPDAPALDGVLLDGWDSAFLTVTYRPGRVLGRLLHCPEDSERVAALRLDGWQLIARPNPLQLIANAAGRTWNGVPSFAPVPGGVASATQRTPTAEREVSPTIDAPAPMHQEIKGALTESPDGFLLGVTPDGSGVRLARRAMTVAVAGPRLARQNAVLALLRRGMQAGLGIIVMVDRALLPTEALQAWEARLRLLDVQNITDSSAIPWREIAPDLLAQAIGGPSASLPALPSRFAAVLDTLHAESLRVPAVLGLATMPGDNLRGVLAAGGLVVVPQDGDVASTIVARLLMAYLATPPAIGRGLLLLTDAAIIPPEALREQVIQVVVGERGDALLRLAATDTGWRLSAPDGSPVAELLPDLLAQPAEGAGDLVDSIVRDIGTKTPDTPAVAVIGGEAPIEEAGGWWAVGERIDDLNGDEAVAFDPADEVAEVSTEDIRVAMIEDLPAADLAADQEWASDLDLALGSLLHALMTGVPVDATEALIQAAVTSEDFATADATALAWSKDAPQLARPWIWRVVLAEQDDDRVAAAWQAIQIDSHGTHVVLVRAVFDAMEAIEPHVWVSQIGDQVPAERIDEEPQIDELTTVASLMIQSDVAELQVAADLPNVDEWPITFAEPPALVEGRKREVPLAESWKRPEASPIAAHSLPDAGHVEVTPIVAVEEQHEGAASFVPVVEPAVVIASPTAAAEDLSDEAIRAIWKSGESVPQLVARLIASGVDAQAARGRVRAIVGVRPATTAAELVARCAPSISASMPAMSMAPLVSEPMISPLGVIATTMPIMPSGEIDDAAIWQLWQAGTKTDDISIAICGKRGGPKADAARDRMYSVVIPRIVADLNCDDLLNRIAADGPTTADSRYSELMKRLARSEHAPVGNLERSLIKRLISARQEL